MNRTYFLSAASLLLACLAAFVWYVGGPVGQVASSGNPRSEPVGMKYPASTATKIDAAVDEALSGIHQEVQETPWPQLEPAPVGGPSSGGAELDWPRGYERTDFDLTDYFVRTAGSLDYREFVRHVRLNPHDLPLSESGISILRRLIEIYNSKSLPVYEMYSDILQQEMIGHIESGGVEPLPPSRPSDATLRQVAKSRALRAGTYVDDEYQALLEDPSGVYQFKENGILHKGQLYPQVRFHDLPMPETEYALEGLKFLMAEGEMAIVGWFVSAGALRPDTDLYETLVETAGLRFADLSVKPTRRR